MSEPAHRPSPEPSPADVPQWVNDLVPIAECARALLRADAPVVLAAVAVVVVIPQLVARPAPWVVTVCAALGILLALRHGAWNARPTKAEFGDGLGALRPGGRTGALLVVLDLLLSATGLAAWAGLALAGTDRALLVAATGAAAGLAVGGGLVAAGELVGRRSTAAVVALAAVALVVVTAAAYGLAPAALSWWWVLGLTLLVDAVGAIALRVGARNDRRSSRPVDAA